MSKDLSSLFLSMPGTELRVAAGAALFRRGDPVRQMFLVTAGEIQLLRYSPEGRVILLQAAGPGGLLAEASLHAEYYHCDGAAAAGSTVRAVSRTDLRRRLNADPALGAAWIEHLSKEVQRARMRAEIVSLKTVAQRLDAWLALNDDKLPGKGRWKALAHEVGVSPEALYRELAARQPDDPGR